MRIVHVSDNHGKKINPGKACDLLIHSGDWGYNNLDNFQPCIKNAKGELIEVAWNGPWNFRKIDALAEAAYQENRIRTENLPYFKKKGLALDKVVFVVGNHDYFDPTPIFPNSVRNGSRTVVVNGIKIGLLSGVKPICGEWNDEIDEYEIRQRILALDPDIQILVSHSAPYGVRDSAYGGEHTGSQEIYKAIFGTSMFSEEKPYFTHLTLHCFGHSHEGFGGETHEIEGRKVRFSNAATGRVDIDF